MEIVDFTLKVFHEALLNALAHRDYQNQGSVYVKHYPDKVVIENPGGFPEGITQNNIITHPSVSRNKLIAETLQRLKYVQRTGQGVDIIYRDMVSSGKPYPEYRSYSDAVSLTMYSGIDDIEFVKFIAEEQNSRQWNSSLAELMILRFLTDNRRISFSEARELSQGTKDITQKSLNSLIKKGLIEISGKKYMLTAKMYQAVKSDIEYMQDKVVAICKSKRAYYGIYGSSMNDKQAYDVVNEIVSCWIEQEKPLICGKQLITRSFFLKDFIGRKLITAMPETESNSWRLIFEGGHQLNINENLLYSKETLNPNDLGVFCTSNVQSVLLNPIYAYGKWFYPNDICEEWHKVFLYLCAVSEYEWNLSNMGNVYRRFLKFLEENICLTMKVDPLISKEQYYKVLLIHIENYRAFLKGEDEVVNSKDLYQTLNTRYVYLLYLQELVKQENLQHSFSCFELQKEIDCALQIFLWMNGITSDSQEEIQRKINQNRSIGICKRII